MHNLTFAACLCLIWICFQQNLLFCKTHLFGFTAENKLLERIISRIEEHPNYNTQSMYTIVQAGEIPLRRKYYTESFTGKSGYYTVSVPYFRHWIAFEYYNFYAPENFVKEGTFINPSDISQNMVDFLSRRIAIWPSEEALYVDDKYAIMALTPKGKELLTSQFNILKGQ